MTATTTTTQPTPRVIDHRTRTITNRLHSLAEMSAESRDILSRIHTVPVNLVDDIDIVRTPDEESDLGKMSRTIRYQGKVVEQIAGRFTTSVAGILGTSLNNLHWIGYQEMADRILRTPDSRMANLTILRGKPGGDVGDQLLAVTPLTRDVLPIDDVVSRIKPDLLVFVNGNFLMSREVTNISEMSILGDRYCPSNYLRVPADGWGNVRRTLGVLRAICTNGMLLMDSAYEEVIENSSDKFSAIYGALQNISESAIDTLHKRMSVADRTIVSGREFRSLLEGLVLDRRQWVATRQFRDNERKDNNTQWFGDMQILEQAVLKDQVGLSGILDGDLEILGALDCKVSVIDAVNMFTEISTHRLNDESFISRSNLNTAIGKLLAKKRFNLEGSDIESKRQDFWFAN